MHRTAFEAAVARHRAELHAHCYRTLGSVHDADDALQDALLGAWKGPRRLCGAKLAARVAVSHRDARGARRA